MAMKHIETRDQITLKVNDEKVFAVFHHPIGSNKAPAVLICPGFAGNKCGKFRIYVLLAQELAKIGIATLRFDYRGSGDSEGEFQDMTFEGKVQDTLKCLEFLETHPHIDPSKIAILGRSLGGAIAIIAASRYKKIKSIALWAAVFKSEPWETLWETTQKKDLSEHAIKEMMSTLSTLIPNKDFLSQFFSIDIKKEMDTLINIPLLHIHGGKDKIVKVDHAKDYENARNGIKNSRFIFLKDSDHDFSNLDEQKIAIEETCQWFKQTL